jgi:hypothetical protein
MSLSAERERRLREMKKEIMTIMALFIIIPLIVSAISPAFADIGTDINSYWAFNTPTINGTISPGEWTDAAVRNFTLDMRTRLDGTHVKYLNGTMYVKNDYSNLYIAVKIYNDTYWATDLFNRYKTLAILFNGNDNGSLGYGENGEGISTWRATGSPFYFNNDLYYDKSSTPLWLTDVIAGKTNDGNMNYTHSNPVQNALGTWTFEMSIPLVGSDLGYDFNIAQLPKEIGYKLWFGDNPLGADGVYPDQTATPISLEQTFDAATYGDIIIHPLYYLTILPSAGGTTSPAPGTYPYGYGTMVSVSALPNGGYMLDHWVLDSVNVGTANPYVVTMNQNHTLQALFKTIPPVGGISLKPTALPSIAYYSMILAVLGVAVSVIRRKKR